MTKSPAVGVGFLLPLSDNQSFVSVKNVCLFWSFLFCFSVLSAQQPSAKKVFTRAETLRGALSPSRSAYDVTFYNLTVEFDIANRSIKGRNAIYFFTKDSADVLQIDLTEQLEIDSVLYHGDPLPFMREFSAVFVPLPEQLPVRAYDSLVVYYHGKPQIAKHAPWDGGFVWTQDEKGNPWVAVACEGLGASSWWPCKDHPSDEPDSIQITCIVPAELQAVCNGNLRSETNINASQKAYTWFVSYPINLYNVTFNIGKYAHFHDKLTYSDGTQLDLDYYVMPYHEKKAHKHFEQVKPMLLCYEKYLGKYPFMRDGYALVETPYLGMEHQSAIAYGNGYKTGYAGRDHSGIGLDFDYIIIHESAHEWWGNSVSCSDVADMWIHESFATYTEAIYVEHLFGKEKALKYINARRKHVKNEAPIQGIYGGNNSGDGDMYLKGALMLNSIRSVINDDAVWWNIIKGISDTFFKYQTVSADEVIYYMEWKSGKKLAPIFEQYLKHAKPPKLHYLVKKMGKGSYAFSYYWEADVRKFNMPVIVEFDGQVKYLPAQTDKFLTEVFQLKKPETFKVKTDLTYFDVLLE